MSNISNFFTDLIGTQIQDIENKVRVLYFRYSIDHSSGATLDNIGVIVGQPRKGMSDENYRRFIKAKIGLNSSEGNIDHIIKVWQLLSGTDDVELQEVFPGKVKLKAITTFPTGFEEAIWDIMEKILLGGVGLAEIWFDDPSYFGFGATRGKFSSDWTYIYKK